MTNAARQSYGSAAMRGSVILLDGAFRVGKSTVALRFRDRVAACRLYDPERLGYVMRRVPRWFPGSTAGLADYRHSQVWRALTVRAIQSFAPASTEGEWVYPRASAACREHLRNHALVHRIDTDLKAPDAIVDELIAFVEEAIA